MKKYRLGIIGSSPGNGHPYSWSAIFNGFDKEVMSACPYPVIPNYLARELFPDNFLGHLAHVDYIWTQDRANSEHIATAARIPNIVADPEEMIGCIDGLLLARDDAEFHYEMAHFFLKAGIPVYIDKPLAYDVKTAKSLMNLAQNEWQLFTCSAMRFAKEINLSDEERTEIGEVRHIQATIPKDWKKYAVHIIEPSLAFIPNRGAVSKILCLLNSEVHTVTVQWENAVSATYTTLGSVNSGVCITLYGSSGTRDIVIRDTFYAFKHSLKHFVSMIARDGQNIGPEETIEIIDIIERGMANE